MGGGGVGEWFIHVGITFISNCFKNRFSSYQRVNIAVNDYFTDVQLGGPEIDVLQWCTITTALRRRATKYMLFELVSIVQPSSRKRKHQNVRLAIGRKWRNIVHIWEHIVLLKETTETVMGLARCQSTGFKSDVLSNDKHLPYMYMYYVNLPYYSSVEWTNYTPVNLVNMYLTI